jgi:hypothetical protein
MHKNYFWQAFLIVVFAVTLWYTTTAITAYYSYSHFNSQTDLSALNWEVVKESEEDFVTKAVYTFEFHDKSYPGTTTLKDTPYRNHWAAEQAVKELSKRHWKVWFDPQNPDYSSLEKSFPFKATFSAIFLWGLILYFLFLGFYVTKFKGQT